MFGKLMKITGNQITVQLDDEFDIEHVTKFADGKKPIIELGISDGRKLTPDQRKKAYALMNDIAKWCGYFTWEIKEAMKFQYYYETGADEFSLSNCSVSTARKFIEFLIKFALDWDIPFKTRTYDMIQNDFYFQYQALLHRRCVICGRHADIDHIETVGMGRNRKNIDNTKLEFESLCRDHHMERHRIGIETFMQKYHIKPVKLNAEQVKTLHIGGTGNEQNI